MMRVSKEKKKKYSVTPHLSPISFISLDISCTTRLASDYWMEVHIPYLMRLWMFHLAWDEQSGSFLEFECHPNAVKSTVSLFTLQWCVCNLHYLTASSRQDETINKCWLVVGQETNSLPLNLLNCYHDTFTKRTGEENVRLEEYPVLGWAERRQFDVLLMDENEPNPSTQLFCLGERGIPFWQMGSKVGKPKLWKVLGRYSVVMFSSRFKSHDAMTLE